MDLYNYLPHSCPWHDYSLTVEILRNQKTQLNDRWFGLSWFIKQVSKIQSDVHLKVNHTVLCF